MYIHRKTYKNVQTGNDIDDPMGIRIGSETEISLYNRILFNNKKEQVMYINTIRIIIRTLLKECLYCNMYMAQFCLYSSRMCKHSLQQENIRTVIGSGKGKCWRKCIMFLS